MATTTTTDRRGLLAFLLGATLPAAAALPSGCSSVGRTAPRARAPAHVPPVTAALLDYVPAAGLRWLATSRPERIASHPDFASSVALLLPRERLAALEAVTGVRLERLKTAAVAGFDLGTLYLAEISTDTAARVRDRFAARLVEGGVRHRRNGIHRIVGTTASGQVRALVTVNDGIAAFAAGDPQLARIVEAYAEGRLRSPTALRGAALRELPAGPRDALFTFLAPGPFRDEWSAGARGLIGATLALAIAVQSAGSNKLRATLVLVGDWQERAEVALHELKIAWRELASGPTGRLLGLDRADELAGTSDLQRLTLSAEFEIGPLARGLRHATSADVREILELESSTTPATPDLGASPPAD